MNVKTTKACLLVCASALLLLVASGASADTLTVTDMTGSCPGGAPAPQTAIGAMEGDCALEVDHDNTSSGYVRDDTPDAEAVMRGSFLFNPNDIGNGAGKFRQNIFSIMSLNPDQGGPTCGGAARVPMLRAFLLFKNGNYSLQGMVKGNACGDAAVTSTGTGGGSRLISLNPNDTVKICFEVSTGSSLTGFGRFAVVAAAAACPTSADAAPWFWRPRSNQQMAGDQSRMGTVATNNFGAGESGTLYYDDFQSFRTLTP